MNGLAVVMREIIDFSFLLLLRHELAGSQPAKEQQKKDKSIAVYFMH